MSSEPINHDVVISLTRIHNLGREIRVVHRIWKALGLQAQCSMFFVNISTFPLCICQHITCVKLNTGLVSPQLHFSTRFAIYHHSSLAQMLGTMAVQHIVYIISTRELIQLAPYCPWLQEIIRCPFYRCNGTSRDELFIHRSDLRAEELDSMRQDITTVMATKIPVGIALAFILIPSLFLPMNMIRQEQLDMNQTWRLRENADRVTTQWLVLIHVDTLVSPQLHFSTRFAVYHHSSLPQMMPGTIAVVQHIVYIISTRELIQLAPYSPGLQEIIRCPFHRFNGTSRDELFIHGSDLRGEELDIM
nr:hypothetical protein Iba_chr01bCG18970 [Ipomoea batatas]